MESLSHQEGVTVMQHSHTKEFTPFSTESVKHCMSTLLDIMNTVHDDARVRDIVNQHDLLRDFAQKYTVFYEKLTNRSFIGDPENIRVLMSLIQLKASVDIGAIDADAAKAMSSDVALKSLVARVKDQKQRAKHPSND